MTTAGIDRERTLDREGAMALRNHFFNPTAPAMRLVVETILDEKFTIETRPSGVQQKLQGCLASLWAHSGTITIAGEDHDCVIGYSVVRNRFVARFGDSHRLWFSDPIKACQ